MKDRLQFAFWHAAARTAGRLRALITPEVAVCAIGPAPPGGISLVIPSRNGRHLLAAQLPGIFNDLSAPAEVIVVDNGSVDGTAEWLRSDWPQVEVELCRFPLSFAAAVNRGIARARYSHICLLNNDMLLQSGFFAALLDAFRQVPGLFCATAQICFPAGVRREETGKAVMAQNHPDDFPLRCDEPIPGEDLSYVLYGSGGCSLYNAAMLRALGSVDEAYFPAYVEDLDLGFRAWQRGWPSVFVAGALVEHRHRATTSRYFSEEELAEIVEVNYLRFLTRAVASRVLFRELWTQAIDRLWRRRNPALRFAARLALSRQFPAVGPRREKEFLALTSGDVAVFPGKNALRSPLVSFADRLETPPAALLEAHREVVLVRKGNELALCAALQRSEEKWRVRGQMGRPETRGSAPACPET